MNRHCLFCKWVGPENKWAMHLPRCPGTGGRGRPKLRDDQTEIATDGGQMYHLPEVGDAVLDRNQVITETQPAIYTVVAVHPTAVASDFENRWTHTTVAQENPIWDDGAPVVEVVLRDDIFPGYQPTGDDTPTPEECRENDIFVFSHPAPRVMATEKYAGAL